MLSVLKTFPIALKKYSIVRACTYLLLLIIGGGSVLTSCTSPRSIVYFQGESTPGAIDAITQTYVPTIQPNDLLSVVVGSLSAESNEIFNLPNQLSTSAMSYGAGGGQQPVGYLVDQDGHIDLPLAGKIHIGSLTTQKANETIRKALLPFLREPTVSIRTLNFKVSVLGEVNRPAIYVIPDEKITLPEVLSLAGDMTIFGRRDNILIIREENGQREYIRLDLTSRDIFKSPYYYLRKNDVLYVEPVKARMASTDRTLQIYPIVLGTITALSLIVVRFF
jgi:polysaccharide biosynthesis/export protein